MSSSPARPVIAQPTRFRSSSWTVARERVGSSSSARARARSVRGRPPRSRRRSCSRASRLTVALRQCGRGSRTPGIVLALADSDGAATSARLPSSGATPTAGSPHTAGLGGLDGRHPGRHRLVLAVARRRTRPRDVTIRFRSEPLPADAGRAPPRPDPQDAAGSEAAGSRAFCGQRRVARRLDSMDAWSASARPSRSSSPRARSCPDVTLPTSLDRGLMHCRRALPIVTER